MTAIITAAAYLSVHMAHCAPCLIGPESRRQLVRVVHEIVANLPESGHEKWDTAVLAFRHALRRWETQADGKDPGKERGHHRQTHTFADFLEALEYAEHDPGPATANALAESAARVVLVAAHHCVPDAALLHQATHRVNAHTDAAVARLVRGFPDPMKNRVLSVHLVTGVLS